jgi:hypothetical protein
MKKIISDETIHFYDDENNEIMYIDHSTDECIWYFHSDSVINVTADMELYNLLRSFMTNYYDFNDEILLNYKDSNKLIWYSDCYYNPDDKWSIASVSCLNIERNDFCFKIWCTKKIDEMIDRPHKTYGICFSPAGNGKYSKNLNTGLTLQDDFITHIYQPLLTKNKVLKR